MKKKRQSYRERYFSDFQAVQVSANNRKGYRIVYQYTGLWKSWENAGKRKWLIGMLEIAGLILFGVCAAVDAPINRARFASGFGVLSVAAWLAELSGVLRFLAAKEYIRELSWDETDRAIRYGCIIRGTLTELTGLLGIADSVGNGTAGCVDWLILAGLTISSLTAFATWRLYGKLRILTYHNQNGRPGDRV